MRTAQIYVLGDRLDLFKDEEINVTSSVQNIDDISKVFTDFSQSFTVPASKNNNEIFQHWYQNDGTYDLANGVGFDAKTRIDARIEINLTPFRKGKIQLEGAEVKDGQVESYKITFYGDVVSLKDTFGDKKLADLDYSTIAEAYTGANVKASLTTTTSLDVRYPLISSDRVWTYGDTPATTDIADSSTPVVYSELFPALKTKKIFDLIESYFGVTFSGTFLDNKRFTNEYTLWKNRKTTGFNNQPMPIEWTPTPAGVLTATNSVHIAYNDMLSIMPAGATLLPGSFHYVNLWVTVGTTGTFDVKIYMNGTLWNTLSHTFTSGNLSHMYTVLTQGNWSSLTAYDVTFTISSVTATTVQGSLKYWMQYSYIPSGGGGAVSGNPLGTSPLSAEEIVVFDPITISNEIDWNNSAPDMKIADFFSGTLKEFNLTCYPLTDALDFQVEPLALWYSYGGKLDITPYVDTASLKYDRPKLYKEISYSWEKSKSFLNEAFAGINDRQYGSLSSTFANDGGKFDIKLPFENLLFQKFTGENLQVGFSLDSAFKSYIPKVTKLYLDESIACDFYFDDGTGATQILTYMPFGQDIKYNLQDHSLNFGSDTSTLKDTNVVNSLFKVYYEPYLLNLFNPKTRVLTLKCILPISMLTMLSLDDAIIVRDKQYRINSMKSNLSSGVVDLELISDWIVKAGVTDLDPIGKDGGTIVVPIRPVKPERPTKPVAGGGGGFTVSAPAEASFVTCTPSLPIAKVTTEGQLSFVVAPNTTYDERINTLTVVHLDPENGETTTTYLVFIQAGDTNRIITEASEGLLTEDLQYLITES